MTRRGRESVCSSRGPSQGPGMDLQTSMSEKTKPTLSKEMKSVEAALGPPTSVAALSQELAPHQSCISATLQSVLRLLLVSRSRCCSAAASDVLPANQTSGPDSCASLWQSVGRGGGSVHPSLKTHTEGVFLLSPSFTSFFFFFHWSLGDSRCFSSAVKLSRAAVTSGSAEWSAARQR